MDEVKKEHKEQSGKDIKTRYIVYDAAKSSNYDEIVDIAKQLEDIDIALLFLNVGNSNLHYFRDLSMKEVHELVAIN